MKKLILGIGIPASGKSFFLEPFASQFGYKYLCIDQIRAEFGIGRDDPSAASRSPATFEVWDIVRERTHLYLQSEKTKGVIVDATFVNLYLRKQFISIGREYNAKVTGFFMDTTPEVAWNRNLLREHPVPETEFWDRIERLKTNPPLIEEGFDSLFILNENGLIRAQNGSIKNFGAEFKT